MGECRGAAASVRAGHDTAPPITGPTSAATFAGLFQAGLFTGLAAASPSPTSPFQPPPPLALGRGLPGAAGSPPPVAIGRTHRLSAPRKLGTAPGKSDAPKRGENQRYGARFGERIAGKKDRRLRSAVEVVVWVARQRERRLPSAGCILLLGGKCSFRHWTWNYLRNEDVPLCGTHTSGPSPSSGVHGFKTSATGRVFSGCLNLIIIIKLISFN